MLPILQLGPLAIQTPGLILLLGIWIGLTVAGRRAASHGLTSESLDNLVLTALLAFVIGGRLAFVAVNFTTFQSSPLDAFSLNYELFDLTGGLATGLIAGLIYGQRKGLPFRPTLDALTPFFATLAVALGLAHLAGGTAFGKETSLPWGIEMRGAIRHPSQVYETAVAVFILGLVGLQKPIVPAGRQLLQFVAFTAGAALFLEAFRGDSILLAGGIRLGQVVAWIVLTLALIGLEKLRVTKTDAVEDVGN